MIRPVVTLVMLIMFYGFTSFSFREIAEYSQIVSNKERKIEIDI